MRFYDELILSNSISESKEEIIQRITSGKTLYHTYVIMLPMMESYNQLEFMHVELFKDLFQESLDYIIIGIALGYQDALELVKSITEIVYQETGTACIGEYFRNKI